jgi:ribonuclease HI
MFCGHQERVEHLFLFCPFARAVWKEVKRVFPIHLRRKDLINAKQWVFDFLKRETGTHATVLATVIWHIWDARNDARNNVALSTASRVSLKALSYVDMILTHLTRTSKAVLIAREPVRPRWVPLQEGVICINVDAALFPDAQRRGCGIVLRDHVGRFILSVSEGAEGTPSPEMAEALAMRRALVISKEHGVSKAVLISDCLSLIQRINSRQRDRSTFGIVIAHIKSIASDLESCTFKFARRELNVVAHKLARSAVSSVCNISLGVIPGLIRDELCNDVM